MTKITGADITNFQRVEVAKIAPSSHMIVFAGRNAQGKTSGLNAIESALCGHNSRENPRPIKDGAKSGQVDVRLSDGLAITRRYTPSGTTLTVKAEDGGKHGQARLSRLIGSLGMDVSRFTNLGEREQLETLLGVVDLPFVPAEIEAKMKEAREDRRIVNARTKELEAQALHYAGHASDLPAHEISVSELVEQGRAADATNAEIVSVSQSVDYWAEQVEALEDSLAAARQSHAEAVAKECELPAPVDADAIRAQIDTAEETNRAIRRRDEGARIEAQAQLGKAQSESLTAEIDALQARKVDSIAQAQMPVDGLTFDDDGLLYDGIPFSRASSAEKILVSAAILIHLKPELRSIIVRNGNDLDTAHLEKLRAMAEENDFQIFVEIVAESGEFEYTFTDGIIAA